MVDEFIFSDELAVDLDGAVDVLLLVDVVVVEDELEADVEIV
jgi:hypothetical protein